MDSNKQVFLIVLDGFGITQISKGNAVRLAKTPNLDVLWTYAEKKCFLHASESAVGLDVGYTGNSEVGHINLGAGTIIPQQLQIINEQIETGKIFKNKTIKTTFKKARSNKIDLHIIGCLSNAGVHAHIKHLFTLIDIAESLKVKPFLHLFLDGRDSGERDAFFFLDRLKQKLDGDQKAVVATMSGRFYGMDRNTRWERTELAFQALCGKAEYYEEDISVALQNAYKRGEDDESFSPTVIVDSNKNPVGKIKNNDIVFSFNFREDRIRQMLQALADPNFIGFERECDLSKLEIVSLVGYSENLPIKTVFPPTQIKTTVSSLISQNGLSQIHIAETEKYAHVSYFFNGGEEKPHKNEKFFMLPSPQVKDYKDTPEMSARLITEEVIAQMQKNFYNFYLINFSNPDMIGHTGDIESTIKAVEITDECVGKVVSKALSLGATVLITADHGNSESMIDFEKSQPNKAHTLNAVPFMIINPKDIKSNDIDKIGTGVSNSPVGVLADVGTTILHLLGITPPSEMSGLNLMEVI